jgi:chemotaxis protein MotB
VSGHDSLGSAKEFLSAIPMPVETPQPPWLMSFADFVSCLLSCFVLLYSLVAVDQAKLDQILEGVPGRQVIQTGPDAPQDRSLDILPEEQGRNADYLVSVLGAKIQHEPALADIKVEGQGDRVLLHLPPKDLMAVSDPDQAAGQTIAGQAMVYALGGSLGSLSNVVAVEVRPDGPAAFSAALGYAARLAKRLEDAGVAGPVAARVRVAAPGETSGIDIVVFDKAPPTGEAPGGDDASSGGGR